VARHHWWCIDRPFQKGTWGRRLGTNEPPPVAITRFVENCEVVTDCPHVQLGGDPGEDPGHAGGIISPGRPGNASGSSRMSWEMLRVRGKSGSACWVSAAPATRPRIKRMRMDGDIYTNKYIYIYSQIYIYTHIYIYIYTHTHISVDIYIYICIYIIYFCFCPFVTFENLPLSAVSWGTVRSIEHLLHLNTFICNVISAAARSLALRPNQGNCRHPNPS